jgi:hypothetical protein
MKHLMLITLLLCISRLSANGQETPDPDFSKKPYYFQSGVLNSFENKNATIEKKMKALGYGGVDFFYSVPGARSNVRFNSASIPKIIIKIDDNSDPSEMMIVCIGEVKKDERRFKTFKATLLNGTKGTMEIPRNVTTLFRCNVTTKS